MSEGPYSQYMSLKGDAARSAHSVILLKSDSKMAVSMKLALILVIFPDDFDTGDTSAWSNTVPQGSPKPRGSRSVFASDRETLAAAVTPVASASPRCTHGANGPNQPQSPPATNNSQHRSRDSGKSFEGLNLRVVKCGSLLVKYGVNC